MREFLYSLVYAVQFLTRLHLIKNIDQKHTNAQTVLAVFPLAGFLIGCILVVLCKLFTLLCPINPLTMAVIIVTADVILTGALHLDGLADTFDALLSTHTTRDKKLEIMKDSRIGVMGATALIISVLLKSAFIGELLSRNLLFALLIYPAVGRWTQVFFLYLCPYLRDSGTAQFFAQSINRKTLIRASLCLIPCLPVPSFLPVFLLHLAALMLYRRYIQKRIGGITGDILGSASVLSEIMMLLGLTIFYR